MKYLFIVFLVFGLFFIACSSEINEKEIYKDASEIKEEMYMKFSTMYTDNPTNSIVDGMLHAYWSCLFLEKYENDYIWERVGKPDYPWKSSDIAIRKSSDIAIKYNISDFEIEECQKKYNDSFEGGLLRWDKDPVNPPREDPNIFHEMFFSNDYELMKEIMEGDEMNKKYKELKKEIEIGDRNLSNPNFRRRTFE